MLRGPSGAGKSTVGRALLERASAPTVLVARDHYTDMFGGDHWETQQELLEVEIVFCLERGFDVIFEGNFKADTHRRLMERLFAAHPGDNFVFYMDVGLEETLRRHGSRHQIITATRMKELYPAAAPLGVAGEVLIPESASVDDAVRLILATVA